MRKVVVLSTLAATGLLAFNASAQNILAKVLSSTPLVQQVAVPRQVCSTQQVMVEVPKSGAGALMGAVAGGAVGNAIGNGNGRALATMIGLLGGALVGDRIEGGNPTQAQNSQQCNTQTFYENRVSHYNVVYEYQGTQYNTQMAQDPGTYVRLQVTPVGAMSPSPQPGFQQVPNPQSPAIHGQTYQQDAPVQYIGQPGFVVQQPVFVSPVVVQSSGFYGQPYYARPVYPRAHYAPSIQFNYSRGFGHGHGDGRWR